MPRSSALRLACVTRVARSGGHAGGWRRRAVRARTVDASAAATPACTRGMTEGITGTAGGGARWATRRLERARRGVRRRGSGLAEDPGAEQRAAGAGARGGSRLGGVPRSASSAARLAVGDGRARVDGEGAVIVPPGIAVLTARGVTKGLRAVEVGAGAAVWSVGAAASPAGIRVLARRALASAVREAEIGDRGPPPAARPVAAAVRASGGATCGLVLTQGEPVLALRELALAPRTCMLHAM
jgi:hypothetical protein